MATLLSKIIYLFIYFLIDYCQRLFQALGERKSFLSPNQNALESLRTNKHEFLHLGGGLVGKNANYGAIKKEASILQVDTLFAENMKKA